MITEFQNEFRWLSNFAPVKIILNGLQFESVEYAYMSEKSNDPEWKKFCADAKNTPGAVKRKSRTIKLRSDWEAVKLEVMEKCLRQKFSQEPYKAKLLATGNILIQEGNRWNDKFWGVCLKTNKGEIHLGKLIMKIREEINIREKKIAELHQTNLKVLGYEQIRS